MADYSGFDLIVIGGGINGAGVVRDAALRGLKVILIDKGDFGSGTTSWSTRLIHGGVRYLESFELALVRESLREREILLRIAPHLVTPLLMTIPIYRDRSRPYWKIQAGMALYDGLSLDKTLPPHRMLSAQQFRQMFRAIAADQLVGGAQYYDAQVAYAERLVLETLRSAAAAGATLLNDVEVTQLNWQGDRIASLTGRHRLTGQLLTFTGKDDAVIINTAGPWVDEVLSRGNRAGARVTIGRDRHIGGTKGSHIVVAPFAGVPRDTAIYVEAQADGRPFFIVPWLDRVLIGTTDLRYRGDLDAVKADTDEINYLLHETNRVIPTARLSPRDVTFTYAGVRPLPATDDQPTGQITRRHILYDHTPDGVTNLISLVGGKLTTYRQVGQELVDAVYRKQGKPIPPCVTAHQPLPGALELGEAALHAAIARYGDRVPRASLDHLVEMYGARAVEVLALIDADPALAEAIAPSGPDLKAQVVYAVQAEYAHTLVDIAYHRTMLAVRHDYGRTVLPVLTELLHRYCGWSKAECDRQTHDYWHYMCTHCIPDEAIARYPESGRQQFE